ncbi:MAG: hypothetical protein IJI03_14290, partial [Rudaea sp.]|nr:hypothetical protein [Rudaea sp.]
LDYYGFPVVQSTDSAWSGNFYVGPNGHSVYSNISVNNITIEVDTGGFGPPASATCAGTIGPMWWNGADVTTGANATQLSISSATLPNTNSRSTWVCKMNGNLYLSPFQSFH